MAVAPFIKPIQTNKGIFYSFQSALEDINLTFNNGVNKFRFSKFALLDIPKFGTPDTLVTDNKIQFFAPGENPLINGLSSDYNINLAESFQNYALNLEALLISQTTYQRDLKLNVSERVFWKWMKELGAVRWRTATALEKDPSVAGSLFAEEDETNSTYQRVIKYIGDIDVINSVRSLDNSYSELYLYVPTNVGSTPYVLFNSIADNNYAPGMVINHAPTDPLDDAYLQGRHYTDTHPFSLSILADYDLFDGAVTTQISNIIDPADLIAGNWFNGTIFNSYYTDSIVVNSQQVFNVPSNQLINKQLSSRSVSYVRNTLDGVTVDFTLSDYKLANENPTIQTFSAFNDYIANKNFEYNAVLVYYDVYDPNTKDANGNYTDLTTNLYGILFLDKVATDGLEFSIPTITKVKPDPISKINGNAFSFKLNIKFDNTVDESTVEKSVNDFNTFSLDLFLDVLTQFKQIQTLMNDKIVELEILKDQLSLAQDALINTTSLNQVLGRITTLEDSFNQNSALFENTDSVMGLIQKLSGQFNDLIDNKTSISVAYNLDAIKAQPNGGINLRRYSNKLWIETINQQYNITVNSIFNLNDVINISKKIVLVPFTNYVRHENGTIPIALGQDLNLYIDDTIGWKTGQVMDFIFGDPVNLVTYDIKVYTDANNILNLSAAYGKLITIWDETQFTTSSNSPIFRITCMNSITLDFRVDKIN